MTDANRHQCSECEHVASSAGELLEHVAVVHGFEEVPASEVPPLPVLPDLKALAGRAILQLQCGRTGHVPNPRQRAVCILCGARMEVLDA